MDPIRTIRNANDEMFISVDDLMAFASYEVVDESLSEDDRFFAKLLLVFLHTFKEKADGE